MAAIPMLASKNPINIDKRRFPLTINIRRNVPMLTATVIAKNMIIGQRIFPISILSPGYKN